MAKKAKDANYDFKQKAPEHPIGQGSYANLPNKAIYASFAPERTYRDGVVNSFNAGVDMFTKVDENGIEEYGDA